MRKEPLIRQNWFIANPKRTLLLGVAIGLLVFVGMDAGLAYAIKRLWPPGECHISSQAYHHGFKPLCQSRPLWNLARYPLRTNSLGMRDVGPRRIARTSV